MHKNIKTNSLISENTDFVDIQKVEMLKRQLDTTDELLLTRNVIVLYSMLNKEIEKLEERISNIENRNKRVEGDKAWETSSLRKILILILTYIFAVLYLKIADTTNLFLGAVVPCADFFLSTQTLKIIKDKWLSNRK